MTREFRRIHTLNTCNTTAVVACMCNKHRVFKNVGAFVQPTKEEIGAEINQIVQDKDVDTDVAIYEAKELAKKAKSLSFTKLENVGTAAYWETPLNVLHVLANDVAFSISTNLQEDEAESKQKAIALANLIFKKSTP